MIVCGLVSSCGIDADPALTTTRDALDARAPVLIQPGQGQSLLAVTADGFIVYQEGQTVYASRLMPGAPRLVVTQIDDGFFAFPLQVGDVVFLWTRPQIDAPGLGVSPLVMWTSRGGTVPLSAQSSVGLVATAASADSRQILFTTHVDDAGVRGDLVTALTRAPGQQTILASNIALGFPNGPCRPVAGFTGDGLPIAELCFGDETTGTLAVWDHGARRDLIRALATPFAFTLFSDPDIRRFVVNLADGTLATVDLTGRATTIDHANVSMAFITERGTVGYLDRAATPSAVRLAAREESPRTLAPAVRVNDELFNGEGYFTDRALSPDHRLFTYSTVRDPATGIEDLVVADADRGAPAVLDAAQDVVLRGDTFTADSRAVLFLARVDPTGVIGQLMAGDRRGEVHAVSATANVITLQRATGSLVTYAENPSDDALSAQLTVADAGDPSRPPRVISARAGTDYQRTPDHAQVVFSSTSEPAGPGIYLARARL
jgi:hypothetical protein